MSSSFSPTIDLFHFLVNSLSITPESKALQKKFELYDKEHDDYYLSEMEDFAEQEKDQDTPIISDSSYNNDIPLSQGMQYVIFEKDGETFIILQIHGGADIRGGYTRPHIFQLNTNDPFLFSTSQISASAKGKSWVSYDNGESWESDSGEDDNRENKIPESWEITGDGVFYKPTGEPINFNLYNTDKNATQWWHSNKKLIARWAPTLDSNQHTLNKKRLRS